MTCPLRVSQSIWHKHECKQLYFKHMRRRITHTIAVNYRQTPVTSYRTTFYRHSHMACLQLEQSCRFLQTFEESHQSPEVLYVAEVLDFPLAVCYDVHAIQLVCACRMCCATMGQRCLGRDLLSLGSAAPGTATTPRQVTCAAEACFET
jgi:hypothetical protein